MPRAIWKGVITFGDVRLPVKLYAGIEDRIVHFRLLHETDMQPVSQKLVNRKNGREVPRERMRKGVETEDGRIVLLDEEELQGLEPESSRDITIERFVPAGALGHQWYDRPYYLGPDGEQSEYRSLCTALVDSGKEGVGRFVMRGKEYLGALRSEGEFLVLISLRFSEQIIETGQIRLPEFREFEKQEVTMARQLVAMMTGDFRAKEYRDEYRRRLLQLIERKKEGRRVTFAVPRRKNEPDSLTTALQASLAAMEKANG